MAFLLKTVPLPAALAITLAVYALASVVTFAAYGVDKRRAMTSGRRVPERTLHLLELFGGWPGALVGRAVFRHKTRKWSFTAVLFVIVALHSAVWILIWLR